MFLMGAAKAACACASTGLLTTRVVAGFFSSLAFGRIGRGQKPPPQFGHTFSSTDSTQVRQKVHSKVQIIASGESQGRSQSQCSQFGRSSNTGISGVATLESVAQHAKRPILDAVTILRRIIIGEYDL